MVHRKDRANLIRSSFQILQECDYIIKYNNTATNTSVVEVKLKSHETFIIKWIPEQSKLVSNWKNTNIKCPPYAAPTLAQFILKDICRSYEYPYHRVDFLYQGNHTNFFLFQMDEEITPEFENFNLLMTDLFESYGLNKVQIDISKEMNLWDGYKSVVEYLFDIKINLNETQDKNTIC